MYIASCQLESCYGGGGGVGPEGNRLKSQCLSCMSVASMLQCRQEKMVGHQQETELHRAEPDHKYLRNNEQKSHVIFA